MTSRAAHCLLFLGSLVFLACGGDGGETPPDAPASQGGKAGSAGKGGSSGKAGSAGSKAGSAGDAGAGGSLAGASGSAGAGQGGAGQAGSAGSAGAAGSAAGAAGASAGAAGAAGAGAGAGGDAGAAGAAGAGQAGAGGGAGAAGQGGAGPLCPSGLLCGDAGLCCKAGEECYEGACAPACESGVRCQGACCGQGQACAAGVCATPTDPCIDSVDCGPKEFCDAVIKKCLPGDASSLACLVAKPTKPLEPKLLWHWSGSDIQKAYGQAMSAPLVIDLDGDGTPEVIGCSRKASAPDYDIRGFIRVMRGDTGAEVWGAEVDAYKTESIIDTTMAMAAADLSGDGKVAIVARLSGGEIVAFNGDGSLRWKSTLIDGVTPYKFPKISAYPFSSASSVAIADMDGDGKGEVVIGGAILSHDGRLLAGENAEKLGYVNSYSASSIIADADSDGKLDVLGGNAAVRIDGSQIWKAAWVDGFPAIADLDLDGKAELVVAGDDGQLRIIDPADGALITSVALGSPSPGNPTIADFDGDGSPEIGVQISGPNRYTLWEFDKATKKLSQSWFKDMAASSGLFASTAFDFNGDGEVEIVAHDDIKIRVLNGKTGEQLLELPATHGTWTEFVSIADVDGDGSADLLFSANNDYYGGPTNGYYVFSDPDRAWMPTRRIWNQQSYHITNVKSDGRLPKPEVASWGPQGFNNYRVSAQGKAAGAAPDLTVSLSADLSGCPATVALVVSVQNAGSIGVVAGTSVEIFEGNPPKSVAKGSLKNPLLPGQSEKISFSIPAPVNPSSYVAVIDGGNTVAECIENNNQASLGDVSCGKF